MVGAADLERPDGLERLGLQQDRRAAGRPSRMPRAAFGWPRRRASPLPAGRPRSRRALQPPRVRCCRLPRPRPPSPDALPGAVDADRRPRDRLEPLRRDRVAAARARARTSRRRASGAPLSTFSSSPRDRSRSARSRCCSKTWLAAAACEPVGHLAGRLDRLTELFQQPPAPRAGSIAPPPRRRRSPSPDRIAHAHGSTRRPSARLPRAAPPRSRRR